MAKDKFNVMLMDFTNKKIIPYDVLPYFRSVWKDKKWDAFDKSKVKTKTDLKEWIKDASRYMYWARCEYEFVIGPWPYKEIEKELKKIDVHEQLMFNIDLITDILYKEFFKDKKK